MIDSSFWSNPSVLGIIAIIPIAYGVYLGYRRSIPMDNAVKQAAAVSEHSSLIDGFSAFVKDVQEDNKEIRSRLDACEAENVLLREEVRQVRVREEALKIENGHLRTRISELENTTNHTGG